jgi:hypothetical protein
MTTPLYVYIFYSLFIPLHSNPQRFINKYTQPRCITHYYDCVLYTRRPFREENQNMSADTTHDMTNDFEPIIDFSEPPSPQNKAVPSKRPKRYATRKRTIDYAELANPPNLFNQSTSSKTAKTAKTAKKRMDGFSFATDPERFTVDMSHLGNQPEVPTRHFTSVGRDKISLYTTGNVETDPVSGISSPVIRADPPGPAPIVNYDVFSEPYRDTTPSYARLQPFASREQSTPFPKPEPPRRRATSFGGVKKKSRKRRSKKSRSTRKKSRRAGTNGKKQSSSDSVNKPAASVSVVGHLDTGIAADGSDNPDSPHRLFVPVVRDQSSDSGARPITRIASEPDFLPTDKDTQFAHIRSRGATPVIDDPYLFERHGLTDEQIQDFADRYGSRKTTSGKKESGEKSR